jgi:uncharacterized protein
MQKTKNILITGASGLIGTRLTALLQQKGYTVSHLGRSKKNGTVKSFTWDVTRQTVDSEAFKNADTIIHLAGASVAEKRWTAKRKQEILESRTHSTRLLYSALSQAQYPVTSIISASAIGYYGFESNQWLTEESAPGKDYLADVTRQWENEVDKIATLGIRAVKMRIGIVLSTEGGALESMAKPIRLLAGAPLGTGNQYISWIHIDDLCDMFIKAVEDNRMSGPYNAVAPAPVTNGELTKLIAEKLKKPLILPAVPKFALKLILGEMAEIVVSGSRVSPQKILAAGYNFKFTKVDQALDDLLQSS